MICLINLGYMFSKDNAEQSVRSMLKEIGKAQFLESGVNYLQAEDFMDGGTRIKLKLSINIEEGSAVFDFTGSGLQVHLHICCIDVYTL